MPLQDLTPQLRTRLNRMERAVGWFIMIATLLLLVGLGYYIYKTAESRGWFKIKAPYYIYTENGDGLAVGNNVNLMGFNVGHILEITPMPPTWGRISSNNVYIRFEVEEPNYDYIWTDSSKVQVKSGFLGSRVLDISKGVTGYATYVTFEFRDNLTVAEARSLPDLADWKLGQEIRDGTNVVIPPWRPLGTNLDRIAELLGTNSFCAINNKERKRSITAVWDPYTFAYRKFEKTNIYGLPRYEEPALNDQLSAMVAQVKAALPSFLNLTNQIGAVLSNSTQLTANLSAVAASARPAVTNLQVITDNLKLITANLTNGNGSLGQWVIPTNLNAKLDTTVQTANGMLTNLDTNLLTLNLTLQNLANITSNLNDQVQANTNILSNLSSIVVHSDQFIQGLKRFWLFKHLFTAHGEPKGPKTNEPPHSSVSPVQKR